MVEQSAACMHACINRFRQQKFVGWKLPVISVGFGLHETLILPSQNRWKKSGTISALTHAKLVELKRWS